MSRTLEEYCKLPYRMEIVPDTLEGGYAVCYPELPGCITCGDTMEEVLRNAEDAKRVWLEACLEDGIRIPEPEGDFPLPGKEILWIPKPLHNKLTEKASAEGISADEYGTDILSRYA